MYGTFLPLGQSGAEHDPAILSALKQKWTLKVPSFEVWAAGTLYDDPERFQTLMHWALTNRGDTEKLSAITPVNHYDANTKEKGGHWIEEPDAKVRYSGAYASLMDGNDKVVYSPETYGLSRVPGGLPGANMNTNAGWQTEGGSNDPTKKWQITPGSFRPHSQLQFIYVYIGAPPD